MSNARFRIWTATGALFLLAHGIPLAAAPVDTNSAAAPEPAAASTAAVASTNAPASAAPTNATDTESDQALRAYLQLQEQIHETLLAVERTRQQAAESAARNAKAMSDRLQLIEQRLDAQRAADLENAQRANRTLLIVVSGFAAFGCLAVLLSGYLQWRAVNRFTVVASSFAAGRTLNPPPALTPLEDEQSRLPAVRKVPQADARLLAAIERLEKRIQEMEQTSRPPLRNPSDETRTVELSAANGEPGASPATPGAEEPPSAAGLLNKGQSLLDSGKAEEALACFDEVLAAEPNHAEALVKRGAALEQLHKPHEALECYDRAIAADGSLTIAYLHKGGLFNRLERFSEALDCYEKALHTQEQRRAVA